METHIRCNHEWEEVHNNIVCTKCGKSKLKKFKINDDISYGIRKDGRKYTIRNDRNRYFYPDEWNKFYNSLHEKHKLIFLFLIITGARIEEANHFNCDRDLIDDKRKLIRLYVTKRKAKVINQQEKGKQRTFEVSSKLYNQLKKQNIKYPFLGINEELPEEELKRISTNKTINTRELMKRKLKKVGIEDWNNFGLHNIRKTHGMWLKTLGIEMSEICLRLGHNENTYLQHYGSPSTFDRKDKEQMIKIFGGIYGTK